MVPVFFNTTTEDCNYVYHYDVYFLYQLYPHALEHLSIHCIFEGQKMMEWGQNLKVRITQYDVQGLIV